MTSSWILLRTVELSGTYLLHSTEFLLGALAIDSLSKRSSRTPHGNPSFTDRIWKLAAFLGLVTAPLSLFAGWTQLTLKWSLTHEASVRVPSETIVRPSFDSLHKSIPPTVAVIAIEPSDSEAVRHLKFPSTERPLEGGNSYSSESVTSSPGDLGKASEIKTVSDRPESAFADSLDPVSAKGPPAGSTNDRLERITIGIQCLGAAILAWMMYVCLRCALRLIALNRLIAHCESADGPLCRTLYHLMPGSTSIRLLRFPSRTSGSAGRQIQTMVSEPFACGLFRRTIVIPDWVERDLSLTDQKALLAHEVAHLVRRDPWWQLVGEILCTCFAWQPLNFVARRRWQSATELLCDDWAIERGVAATSLASCLTYIVESRLMGNAMRLGLAAVGRSSSLTGRIEWLLRDNRTHASKSRPGVVRESLTAITLGLIVGVCGPHLSFVQPVEGGQNSERITIRKEIESDLNEVLNQFLSMELQLVDDPEASAMLSLLRTRATALKARLGR
jgi:hypothetical protein